MKRFIAWIKRTWSRRRQITTDAFAIVEALRAIRSALDSSTAKSITALIPGDTDEKVRLALVKALGFVEIWPADIKPIVNAKIHKAGSIAFQILHPTFKEVDSDSIIQEAYRIVKDSV
jgi:hypothetical protein